jgi:FeS assembly SUF system protein
MSEPNRKPLPVVPPDSETPSAASTREQPANLQSDPLKTLELKPQIIEAVSTVYDPEIPVNIYELGLIYDIIVDGRGVAWIKMTLTAPACPAAQTLPVEVERKVKAVPGVIDAHVEIVWDPPWDRDRMSDAAKLQLGMF